MTQPMPYPGDLDPDGKTLGGSLRREYRDILGRPLSGVANIYLSDVSATPVQVPVVDGVLDVNLMPGKYRLVAEVSPPGSSVVRYYDEEVVL